MQAPLDALRLALDPSTTHPIDVALVNGEVFMNLATAGPVSEVSSKGMSDASKKLLGPAAVAVAGLRQLLFNGLQPVEGVKLTLPNTPDAKHDSYTPDQVSVLSGDLLVLAAGQARQMARLLNVCPDALLDDGLIDFTLLFGSPARQAAALASEVVASGLSQAQGGVRLLRLPWLIVEAPHGLKCNRDGEPSATSNRLVFEVLPRRILMHLPDRRLLLAGQPAAADPTTIATAGDAAQAAAEAAPAGGAGAHAAHAAAAAETTAAATAGVAGQEATTAAPAASTCAHAAAAAPPPARAKLSKQLSLSRQPWWRSQQKRSMKTGSKPRPRLLLDLWAAQQPPGRLSRLLPRLQKAAGRAVAVAGLLAAGFIAGYHW
uniref:Uncharacterized protein n=1 Tax=Tetradesmus obliquus TaxID=3088 RepID=A0A383WA96_TETOB|eukprot:jgi/Sobl393_1/2947/SZX74548.1